MCGGTKETACDGEEIYGDMLLKEPKKERKGSIARMVPLC